MKKLAFELFVILFAASSIMLSNSCQQEEEFPAGNNETERAAQLLKSATTSDYLCGIVEIIDELAEQGTINKGIYNSLVSKVENAIKSSEKDNLIAFENQLNSFIHHVSTLVKIEKIPPEIAEKLIDKATGGILLMKGYFVDSRDGRKYKVVLIGKQIWMAENLAYLPAVHPASEGSWLYPHYYVYGYNGNNVADAKATTNYKTYGVLYNWPAALSISPSGWHLPSDEEWKQLEMALGMTQEQADIEGFRGTQAPQLKATSGWYLDGNGTNSSGFTALPGGMRDDYESFEGITRIAEFWTSTEYLGYRAYFRHLAHHEDYIFRWRFDKEHGRSLRCIKD